MSTAVLINSADPIFTFEHMMSHRRYFALMAPLIRFSGLPYLLDPAYNTAIPASDWHLNHQKAHSDFATTLPSSYNATPTEIGIPTNQPLMDVNLDNPEQLTWWTFTNRMEHYLADSATQPTLSGTYPFW